MAVYTEVSDAALTRFLGEYAIGGLVAFRGIAEGVENSNFSLRTTQGDFILTLYERRVEPAELPWFLGLMEHLAEQGIVCPLPVRARDGVALRMLCGRHASITTFLPGIWPRDVGVGHCGPLGAALAGLHHAGRGYAAERANALGPVSWGPLLERCRARADEVRPGLAAELDGALARVLAGWPGGVEAEGQDGAVGRGGAEPGARRAGDPGPASGTAAGRLERGHIHADLFPDNVFFLDGAVSGLIDFYFAATDLLAYDVAVCLNAWCFDDKGRLDRMLAAALLRGYEAVRPLSGAERAALPVLCQGAALRFLLTRLYDWLNTPAGAMVVRKDPLPYLHRLRFHLGADASSYGMPA
jgi:homoserine kinase type II